MKHTGKNKIAILILLSLLMMAAFCCCGIDTSTAAGNISQVADQDVEEEEETGEVADPTASPEDFLADIPEWKGYAFCYVNGNKPDFKPDEIWTSTQESLDPLDELGRCGSANSCIGQDGMPTEPRGDISSVEPTGWHTDTYEFVEGELLFNRCHLIGHQLSGDDAVPRNLITGTSYMNRDGMLQFENAIAEYVKATDNHVMYRVTPVFVGDELISRGVHMEAISVEDEGKGLAFNVFCYNVQPGVDIDYKTGDNKLSEDRTMLEDYQAGKYMIIANMLGAIPSDDRSPQASASAEDGKGSGDSAAQNEDKTESDPAVENGNKTGDKKDADSKGGKNNDAEDQSEQDANKRSYVLNTNTKRFHYPDCNSVDQMKDHNRQDVEATRDELIGRGFKPCGNCKP